MRSPAASASAPASMIENDDGRSAGAPLFCSQLVITARAPGRNARAVSRSSPVASGTNYSASMQTSASAVFAGSDVSAASATTNDTRGRGTNRSARRRASEIAPGEKSTPVRRAPDTLANHRPIPPRPQHRLIRVISRAEAQLGQHPVQPARERAGTVPRPAGTGPGPGRTACSSAPRRRPGRTPHRTSEVKVPRYRAPVAASPERWLIPYAPRIGKDLPQAAPTQNCCRTPWTICWTSHSA